MPVYELPIGATEDRVVGTLDMKHAIKEGSRRFEPDLLASVHRGILYVDEVNLLDDHVVDVLLDAAAMDRNIVERKGISFTHPSKFILIGTMNPEEGEIRPQLLDRFGLCVQVSGSRDIEERVTILERISAFHEDSVAFAQQWESASQSLAEHIVAARTLLPSVSISHDSMREISSFCLDVGVDGHRGDITMLKTAKTLCAYDSRTEVSKCCTLCFTSSRSPPSYAGSRKRYHAGSVREAGRALRPKNDIA